MTNASKPSSWRWAKPRPGCMARVLVRAFFCGAAVMGMLVVADGPATARSAQALRVGLGRPSSGVYPALTGPPPQSSIPGGEAEYVPNPTYCESGGTGSSGACDVIPILLDLPVLSAGRDLLLTVRVRWDPGPDSLKNVLVDGLFDRRHESGSLQQEASETQDGPVRIGGSVDAGQAVIRYANPPTSAYDLVVSNRSGANTGYRVDASLEVSSDPGLTPYPPALETSGAASGTSAAAHPARPVGGASTVPSSSAAPSGLSADARLGRVRDLGARASSQRSAGTAVWWLLACLVLSASLGIAILRRRRRGGLAPSPARWFRDLSLFWKLLVPFVTIIVITGVAATFLTTRYLASRAQTTLDQDLLQRSSSAATYLRDQELSLLEAVRFAANIEGLPEAVAANDQLGTGRALASAVAVHKNLDVLAATSLDGVGLVDYTQTSATFGAHSGGAWGQAAPVREVLGGVVDAAGDKHSGFVEDAEGRVMFVVAAPVRTDHLVGAVVAGVGLERLVAAASTNAGAGVALFDASGNRRAASERSAAPALLARSATSGSIRVRADVRGRAEDTAYQPFVARGVRIGTLAVTLPVGSAFAAVRSTGYRLGLLVAFAMAAIAGFGVVFSRYILRTVNPLLDSNRRFGRGDLSVRAPVLANDELGELATGFNAMADQLQASYEELERRVAERTEELDRLYREMVKATEAKSQFFATVSHEFRTPLFAILTNAELLTDGEFGPTEPAEVRSYAATIDQSARLLLDRVNELLDLAKADVDGVVLNRDTVSVPDVWGRVSGSVAALARGADLALEVHIEEGIPPVSADPTRLRQILLNLTSNAIKYTPPGGRVVVRAVAAGDAVAISVADNGIGIPRGVGDRVFEPYYQVQGSRAQRGQASTGLGLALTKRLVEAHGGRISYTSTRRRGTAFTFTLPTATRRQPRRRAVQTANAKADG